MGQKVSPLGFRVGINKNWGSRWFPSKENLNNWLINDDKIRNLIYHHYKSAGIGNIEIERTKNEVNIKVFAQKVGLILGKDGAKMKQMNAVIRKVEGKNKKIKIEIADINVPDLEARLVAQQIATDIENRVSFRSAQKMALRKVMRAGAKGVKTLVAGRLGGTDIAREEGYARGVVPLSTLRTDVDYCLVEANTTYGRIGVRVWINRGEVFTNNIAKIASQPRRTPTRPGFRRHTGGRQNRFPRSEATGGK